MERPGSSVAEGAPELVEKSEGAALLVGSGIRGNGGGGGAPAGVAEALGGSLGTTNCLESILSRVERRVRRVSYWISSDQKRRFHEPRHFWT